MKKRNRVEKQKKKDKFNVLIYLSLIAFVIFSGVCCYYFRPICA